MVSYEPRSVEDVIGLCPKEPADEEVFQRTLFEFSRNIRKFSKLPDWNFTLLRRTSGSYWNCTSSSRQSPSRFHGKNFLLKRCKPSQNVFPFSKISCFNFFSWFLTLLNWFKLFEEGFSWLFQLGKVCFIMLLNVLVRLGLFLKDLLLYEGKVPFWKDFVYLIPQPCSLLDIDISLCARSSHKDHSHSKHLCCTFLHIFAVFFESPTTDTPST